MVGALKFTTHEIFKSLHKIRWAHDWCTNRWANELDGVRIRKAFVKITSMEYDFSTLCTTIKFVIR